MQGKVNFNLVLVIGPLKVSLHNLYKLIMCEMMCWLLGDGKETTENSSVVPWPGA